MKPRIKVVCFFYNEAALLPFFLSHYHYVDTIHAIVSKSSDDTVKLLEAAREAWNVDWKSRQLGAPGDMGDADRPVAMARNSPPQIIMERWEMPNGMDDFLKRDKLNEVITRPDPNHDWYFVVDADEFIFTERGSGVRGPGSGREYLAAVPPEINCLVARMWNVYRHRDDADLDASREPVVLQRRHGVADRVNGENALYQKPIVIRSNCGIQFELGNHQIKREGKAMMANWRSMSFDGAHWANADPEIAVKRRVRDRWERLSENNKQFGLGSQHFHLTENIVRAQCAGHLDDPQVF